MKNITKIFLSVITFCFLFSIFSCDKVEGPFKENTENIDTAKCPVPQFPLLGSVYRKIVIEDFTGHKCVNCPRAHIALKDLITTYGDTIIGIALHVGYFSEPSSTGLYTYDFRTPEGTAIDQFFHVSDAGLPQGMINRTKYNGSYIIDHQSWPTAVLPFIGQQPKLAMQIINNYDDDDSSFCTHIKMTFLENITDTLMFFCCLTEDSIIKPQKNVDIPVPNDVPAYTHMHVFRDGLNGNFGVTLDSLKTLDNSTIIKSYFYNLKGKDYKHKNLKIVSFVYKFSTNEILQAEEKRVMP